MAQSPRRRSSSSTPSQAVEPSTTAVEPAPVSTPPSLTSPLPALPVQLSPLPSQNPGPLEKLHLKLSDFLSSLDPFDFAKAGAPALNDLGVDDVIGWWKSDTASFGNALRTSILGFSTTHNRNVLLPSRLPEVNNLIQALPYFDAATVGIALIRVTAISLLTGTAPISIARKATVSSEG